MLNDWTEKLGFFMTIEDKSFILTSKDKESRKFLLVAWQFTFWQEYQPRNTLKYKQTKHKIRIHYVY